MLARPFLFRLLLFSVIQGRCWSVKRYLLIEVDDQAFDEWRQKGDGGRPWKGHVQGQGQDQDRAKGQQETAEENPKRQERFVKTNADRRLAESEEEDGEGSSFQFDPVVFGNKEQREMGEDKANETENRNENGNEAEAEEDKEEAKEEEDEDEVEDENMDGDAVEDENVTPDPDKVLHAHTQNKPSSSTLTPAPLHIHSELDGDEEEGDTSIKLFLMPGGKDGGGGGIGGGGAIRSEKKNLRKGPKAIGGFRTLALDGKKKPEIKGQGSGNGGEGGQSDEDCDSVCPLGKMPVCATDNKTYLSLCSLKKQSCVNVKDGKQELAVLYQGECINDSTEETED